MLGVGVIALAHWDRNINPLLREVRQRFQAFAKVISKLPGCVCYGRELSRYTDHHSLHLHGLA